MYWVDQVDDIFSVCRETAYRDATEPAWADQSLVIETNFIKALRDGNGGRRAGETTGDDTAGDRDLLFDAAKRILDHAAPTSRESCAIPVSC